MSAPILATSASPTGHDGSPSFSPVGPLAMATGPGERAHYPSTPGAAVLVSTPSSALVLSRREPG
jgi:hypothetical protein